MKEIRKNIEYGVVLEGGGARGAYQIGVWKALLENDIQIGDIAGVSVGALNGALMCMEDYEKAEKIWENITFDKVLNAENPVVEQVVTGEVNPKDYVELTKNGLKVLLDGGLDVTPLKELIDEEVEEEKIRTSKHDFFSCTFSMSEMREKEIDMKSLENGEMKDFLLASAYFPIFKKEAIGGKRYMDGGVANNVPIDMLIKRGVKNIILIRIFGVGFEKPFKIPTDVNMITIAPRVSLGNMFDFREAKAKKNIKIGYYDGLRSVLQLKGQIYYICVQQKETDFIQKFACCNEMVQMALIEWAKGPFQDTKRFERSMFEKVLPSVAQELKLSKEWNYEELYLSILEVCAKYTKVAKYHVYTVDQLEQAIFKKAAQLTNETEYALPLFVRLLLKFVTLT